MRAYRVLVPLLTVAAAVLVPAVASAEPYPAVPPPATVSVATPTVGEPITFEATGFIVGETVEVTVEYKSTSTGMRAPGEAAGSSVVLAALTLPREDVLASATADSNGSISTAVKLTEPGTAVITAMGVQSRLKVTTTVTVKGDATHNKPNLPTTGTSNRTLVFQLAAGVAAIIFGFGLVWLTVVRRRRRTDTTSA